MKRNALTVLAAFVILLAVGFLCCPVTKASADGLYPDGQRPASLSAFTERTQIAVGFQHEWLSRQGVEFNTPRKSWVAVVPASFNITPTVDLIGQFGYNMTSHATRYVVGVRLVVFGGK